MYIQSGIMANWPANTYIHIMEFMQKNKPNINCEEYNAKIDQLTRKKNATTRRIHRPKTKLDT